MQLNWAKRFRCWLWIVLRSFLLFFCVFPIAFGRFIEWISLKGKEEEEKIVCTYATIRNHGEPETYTHTLSGLHTIHILSIENWFFFLYISFVRSFVRLLSISSSLRFFISFLYPLSFPVSAWVRVWRTSWTSDLLFVCESGGGGRRRVHILLSPKNCN